MKALCQSFEGLTTAVKKLHADEQGAEGLEKLLIIAAIVLPLLGLLIAFKGAIGEWVNGQWEEVKGKDQALGEPTAP